MTVCSLQDVDGRATGRRPRYPEYGSRLSRLCHEALFRVLPRHTLAPLRAELHLLAVRATALLRGRIHAATDAGLLVNIGCGPYGREGWVNLDGWPQPGVSRLHDCRRSLPLPDGSARGVFCEHFLEHVDYVEEAPVLLAECRRVLRPGGVLRVVVPDAALYLRAYASPDWAYLRRLHGGSPRTKMEAVNEVFRGGWRHKFAYDFETLAELLRDAGFREVTRSGFAASRLPDLAIDRPEHARESLYVEALK
jgi:predicted SAM-dependent methyltransferase